MIKATKVSSVTRSIRYIFLTPCRTKTTTPTAASPIIPRSLHAIFSSPRLTKSKPTTASAATTATRTIPISNKEPAEPQLSKSNTSSAKANCTRKKRRTLEKMVERFKNCSQSSQFRARKDIYFHTVNRLVKYNRFSLIPEILEYQKRFPDITDEHFTARLITLYGKAGFFDHARKLFDEMPDLKCPRTVYSFNALLSACVDTDRFDAFKEIAKDLRKELGITLDQVSYNVAIKGFCKLGDLGSAELVFDEMVNKGYEPDLVTFNTLLQGFYRNGRFDDGERIWDQMREKNIVPNIRSYNAKLIGLASKKRRKDVTELLEEMRLKGVEPDVFSYNCLIKVFVTGDSLEEAKWWYAEISKNNHAPDRATFETLIPFLCKKRDLDFALEVCEEMFKRKVMVEKEVLQPVVDVLIIENKIQEAEKLVERAKENKYRLFMA